MKSLLFSRLRPLSMSMSSKTLRCFSTASPKPEDNNESRSSSSQEKPSSSAAGGFSKPMGSARGTHDIMPEEHRKRSFVENTFRSTTALYGFGEISTPIFEFTEVFSRNLGEQSDVVSKEMYTFQDRSGDNLTLRPENTAGVVRALLSNGLAYTLPQRFFYSGPMFRYERPQKGRYRQFHQVGVELIGSDHPHSDAEVIAMASNVLDKLGLGPDRVKLLINSLGDEESRKEYRAVLQQYFEGHRASLSADSLLRLDRGSVLRILDSKDKGDAEICANAPLLTDHLNTASRGRFGALLHALEDLGIPFTLDPRLVRGLDYYTHTAFEFVSSELGAHSAVLAGGRYDKLVKKMGGPEVPGIGWAAGLERLCLLTSDRKIGAKPRPIAVICSRSDAPSSEDLEAADRLLGSPAVIQQQQQQQLGEADTLSRMALKFAEQVRKLGYPVTYSFHESMKKQMTRATSPAVDSLAAIIVDSSCLTAVNPMIGIKDLRSGKQEAVEVVQLETYLKKLLR